MDRLFSPWRYAYVSAPSTERQECLLCEIAKSDPSTDESQRVVGRFEGNFILLNRYPYNTAHLLIAPYAHGGRLSSLSDAVSAEMFTLVSRCEVVLGDVYRPEGFNVGLNLGACAGAGVADHVHIHVVPRWSGDTNFMAVAGETRVLPESLEQTWRRLVGRFGAAS